MRSFPIKALTVALGMTFTGACGSLKHMTPAQPAVVPVSKVTNSASVVDPDYQIGRVYQSRQQYEAAIAAYRKSLELNPGNVEAHNALGVIYATLGKHEQAVGELMAALALVPSAAHIHNNLGYANLLRGRHQDAVAALRVATGLDPLNQRAILNMRAAETALAQSAQLPDAPALDSVEGMIKSPKVEETRDPSTPQLLSVAPNIYELRQGLRTVKDAAAGAPVRPIAVNLEVANGSGLGGLAKRTSASLRERGYAVARITNQIPYRQVITVIQYRRGEESLANELNARLSAPAKLVEASHLSPGVNVRLLLGRDVGQAMTFTESFTGGRPVARLLEMSSKGQFCRPAG